MHTPARFLAPDSRLITRAAIQRRLHNVSGEKFAPLTERQKSNAARWILTAAIVFIVTVVALRAWFA